MNAPTNVRASVNGDTVAASYATAYTRLESAVRGFSIYRNHGCTEHAERELQRALDIISQMDAEQAERIAGYSAFARKHSEEAH